MFTFFKLFVRGAFVWALSAWVLGALAQVAPAQSTASSPLLLSLNAKQQASLGVQVATVQASTGGQLLASATVVMPPGKEFTVSAPYAGQVSRLLVGVGDSVKAGAALAHFTSPMMGDAPGGGGYRPLLWAQSGRLTPA